MEIAGDAARTSGLAEEAWDFAPLGFVLPVGGAEIYVHAAIVGGSPAMARAADGVVRALPSFEVDACPLDPSDDLQDLDNDRRSSRQASRTA